MFLQNRAGKLTGDDLTKELGRLGYADEEQLRVLRFLHLERNYAYTWFTREIVGIDYCSTNRVLNDVNTDGAQLLPSFPVPPKPTSFNEHSFHARRELDRNFAMKDELWTTNALGFRTAEGFSPFNGKETPHVEARSWADLYIYAA